MSFLVKPDYLVTRVKRSFKKVFFSSEVMRGMKGQWTAKYQQVRDTVRKNKNSVFTQEFYVQIVIEFRKWK